MVNKLMIFFFMIVLTGCSLFQGETMDLLDEKIASVSVSKTKELGAINEDVLHVFRDDESLTTFRKAITSARKQNYSVDIDNSDYDLMIEYVTDEGALPAHPIHLWLGEEGKHSYFMYMIDTETLYKTSGKTTSSLRVILDKIE